MEDKKVKEVLKDEVDEKEEYRKMKLEKRAKKKAMRASFEGRYAHLKPEAEESKSEEEKPEEESKEEEK